MSQTRAEQVRAQLSKHLNAHAKRSEATTRAGGGGGGTSGTDHIRRALVRGYFANAARHEGGGYYVSVLRGASLKLHPNCTLYAAPPEWLVFHETTYTSMELILSATKVRDLPRSPHRSPYLPISPTPYGAFADLLNGARPLGGPGGRGLAPGARPSLLHARGAP